MLSQCWKLKVLLSSVHIAAVVVACLRASNLSFALESEGKNAKTLRKYDIRGGGGGGELSARAESRE